MGYERVIGIETEVGALASQSVAFDHPFFKVIQRVVRKSDGTDRELQLVWDRLGKRFAVVVAITTDGNFVLVEEPKYGQMRRMVSTPTGGVKKNEQPVEAAIRELLEETGYGGGSMCYLTPEPIIDFADKIDGGEHYLFLATEVSKIQEPKNPDQKVVVIGRDQLLYKLIPSGRVPAMSMAALLLVISGRSKG